MRARDVVIAFEVAKYLKQNIQRHMRELRQLSDPPCAGFVGNRGLGRARGVMTVVIALALLYPFGLLSRKLRGIFFSRFRSIFVNGCWARLAPAKASRHGRSISQVTARRKDVRGSSTATWWT
jgi:hypothetical protein